MRTLTLQGLYRSFAWDRTGSSPILVGDEGRVVRLEGNTVTAIASGTNQNLRGISINPTDGAILVVGNAGSASLLHQDSEPAKLHVPTSGNLRAVSWNADGAVALIAGNAGTLLEYSDGRVQVIDGARANLRHVAWKPRGDSALITSNCFAEEFVPSPNLFAFDGAEHELTSLNEGRADLIGAAWKPNGSSALVVGYDVIWHNGVIASFDGERLTHLTFDNKRVYPVAVSWNPTNQLAAVATAVAQPGMGEGGLFFWSNGSIRSVFSSNEFFFNTVDWSHDGRQLLALGSSATRTFNC